ncbi:MAG: porphobilinogen synthase [Candidatus Omnitrophica bacterium]|nr:porphobilinogen synthase [Candidatus Omnitrophota bacterium]
MAYPEQRLRRLRQSESLRRLIRETRVSVDQLVMPLFVRSGTNVRTAIPSMPGQHHFSVDQVVKECQELHDLRIPAVLLFGIPRHKDEKAGGAYAKDGVVQQAVRAIKSRVPELAIITDVCLCAYMSHGHCGVVKPKTSSIDNDASIELLAKTAVSHAQAGADIVAPSDMMDGRVGAIRRALDGAGRENAAIMSYAAKYASQFYGPFREAVESAPRFGDRKSYQMDAANAEEALREVALDIEEGADIVMVKPALAYLDVIARIKQRFHHPLAAFNVSGEYAMVKAAATRGWLIERPTWFEMLVAMRRAGADILITYWAKDAAKLLREK